MARLVIDPVTRIEGHLRIEAQLDGGKVSDAWSSGTMFRGMEIILEGRDPREAWIWAQRICGVCTVVHALASVRAVENALNIPVPENARLVRDLMAGAQQGGAELFYERLIPALHQAGQEEIFGAIDAEAFAERAGEVQ